MLAMSEPPKHARRGLLLATIIVADDPDNRDLNALADALDG